MDNKVQEGPQKEKAQVIPRGAVRRSIILDIDTISILNAAMKKHPGEATESKLIRYAIRKAFKPWRQRVAEKINEHDRKAEYWRDILADLDEIASS